MVVASVSTEPIKFELKSLDGGFVTLRRMSYGEKLHRQELAVKQTVEADQNSRQMTGINIEMLSRKVAQWEFANLIVDHNLEHRDETPFVFSKPGEVDKLDPRVGDEINQLIANMNNFEEGDQKGN